MSACKSFVCLSVAVAVCGCAKPPPNADEPFVIETPKYELPPVEGARTVTRTDPDWPGAVFLTNGLIGARIGADGLTLASVARAGDYQSDGEEKLRVSEQATDLFAVEINGHEAELSETSYRQTLDFATGILTTVGVYKGGDQTLPFESNIRLHPNQAAFAVRLELVVDEGAIVTVEPSNDAFVDSVVVVQKGETWRAQPGAHSLTLVYGDVSATAAEIFYTTRDFGIHSIDIEGPLDDEQAVNSFLFYLTSAIRSGAGPTAPPFGLSSARYFGHVFWDADTWIFPALMLVAPQDAAAIAEYRIERAAAARLNFIEWVNAGYPSGGADHVPSKELLAMIPANVDALKYPWESSVSGRETVPGESRFQEHITGDVALMLAQAGALGLAPPEQVERIGKGAAAYLLHRSTMGENGLEILGTMSPDEFYIGDNDLYTNVLAEWIVNFFLGLDVNYMRPRDEEGRLITYDDDPMRAYKQAAAVLAIWPLQEGEAEERAIGLLERYEEKITPNGPAMSDSVHALIRARFGDPDVAYQTWRQSWLDHTNQPLLQFSEKKRSDESYFLTGAAGCLDAVLYGFCGLRLDTARPTGVGWSMQLRDGWWLSCSPNLPSAWDAVTLRLEMLGEPVELRITHDGVRSVP